MTHANDPSDFFLMREKLTPQEHALSSKIRAFVNERVLPVINEAWERAEFPRELLPAIRELGIVGTTINGYEAPGMTLREQGLTAFELSRGDGSLNTFLAVHSGLTMGTIHDLGSEAQQQRWLPRMSRLEQTGAFALTEPEHGSDAVALETYAEKRGSGYVLNGRKRWIGNGATADVVIIWARDRADEHIKAFVMTREPGQDYPEGYHATPITGKIGKRAVEQADLVLTDLFIPEDQLLSGSHDFSDVVRALDRTRLNVGWSALGHATAAFEIALEYATEREQFGAPIASYQLVQQQLVQMLTRITSMYALCFRITELAERGEATGPMTSLLKMHTANASREVCRAARDLLAGNGILLERHVARHLTDSEINHTYEGTESIQTLLIGRHLTGISAFSRHRRRRSSDSATPANGPAS
ncbi:acyl-CoA dehydrogenase family protein [Leucobacter sp. M11]|uniref:acyl-CoA dehydrogenase family protein n=1 Tax=Leucobacter sp. M11 TaxID=2993565 RepID=UPI002D7F56CD|nr:acyl-CoA dehydrogenase family protein [Leucobacter sp. M11]MEB4615649.1 acyl-CoA dehydrogenase family protein [Leucobacter sp. M11]